jgi:cytochrome P450
MLTDNQDAQSKLRSEIRLALSKAQTEKRPPSYQEIIKTAIPHLEAVTKVIRYARTVLSAIRTAMVDTTVLGCRIPKGTNVFLSIPGPGIFSPAFPIDDSLRSQSALAAKDVVGGWGPDNMGEFQPERWLVEKDGKTSFDPNAGPTIALRGGPRGCYGKRLAYLQLGLVLVLIAWNFELREYPEELSGWAPVDKFLHTPAQ